MTYNIKYNVDTAVYQFLGGSHTRLVVLLLLSSLLLIVCRLENKHITSGWLHIIVVVPFDTHSFACNKYK